MTRFEAEIRAPALPIVQGSTDRAAVIRLQEWLVVRGYRIWRRDETAPGIDGDFGAGTMDGVIAFARDNSIPTVVDERFWERLVSPILAAFSFKPRARDLGAAIVEVAEAHLLQQPREARDAKGRGLDNSGPWPRAYCGGLQVQWCQGAASTLYRQAAAALGATLPFALEGQMSGGGSIAPLWVPDIADSARRAGRFRRGADAVQIQPGAMFFVKSAGSVPWVHVGIVVMHTGDRIETIEGNTNDDGSSNGLKLCRRSRAKASCDYGIVTP